MNFRLVYKHLGVILFLLSGAMVFCLGLSYVISPGPGHSNEIEPVGWIISTAITAVGASVLIILGRKGEKSMMLRKDAIGLVGIGWLTCCLFGSLPFLFCKTGLSYSQALFESVSGLTTTGATVFSDLTEAPKSIVIWRSMSEWMGGMGILAMFILVSASLGAKGKSLFRAESSMHSTDVVGTTMRQTARWLWMLYISLTIVCGIGLWLLGMTGFQAINYAMTTAATGGFGTENDSVSGFGIPIRIWIMIFMIIGAISFPLYLALLRGRARGMKLLREHEETWKYLGLVLVAVCLLFLIRILSHDVSAPWFPAFIDTSFNAVSVATSTGFSVGDYDSWPSLAKGIILGLMIVGGCAGSTSGGLKISRLILLIRVVRNEIRRVFRPHLVKNIKLNGQIVPQSALGQLLVIFASAVTAAALGSYILIGIEPNISADGCASAVVSCLSNIGPAFGEFGPTENYASLSSPSLVLLSGLMILGRLEYVAVLVLLSRQLWKRY